MIAMVKCIRISLAGKCQLLFGFAVVLILVAALAVVWQRMQNLVDRGALKRTRDFANTYIDGSIQQQHAVAGLEVRQIDPRKLDPTDAQDPFVTRAIQRFGLRPSVKERFTSATDANGNMYYRYARAIRAPVPTPPDKSQHHDGFDDSPTSVLLIELSDHDTSVQQMINRIYIVAAGLAAGLIAIAVFWFITTRLILSPIRLLGDYAQKVSEGDVHIRADVNTGDEFQKLCDMFNAMLDKVKVNEEDLRAANKTMELKLGEIAESNVALYEANKIKGEFLANVSHELRTPLNSIVGFGEVLQESLADRTGPVDEKRKRYIANIITSSRRLLDLINDLLDLAKIEAGRMKLTLSPVSVSDTAEGLINLIRPLAEKRQITLHLKLEPNLPVARTDAGKLQQILFNFLANAVKFTPIGGTVTLAARQIAAAPQNGPTRVCLSVSDTGPGISPEYQERIFEKFSQLDPTATKEHGGTGLGLTISRELAELLQGSIELDGGLGHGATFSLIVPIDMTKQGTPLMPQAVGA